MPEADTDPTTVSAAGELLRLSNALQRVSLQDREQPCTEGRGRDVRLELRREGTQAAFDRREGRRRAARGKRRARGRGRRGGGAGRAGAGAAIERDDEARPRRGVRAVIYHHERPLVWRRARRLP